MPKKFRVKYKMPGRPRTHWFEVRIINIAVGDTKVRVALCEACLHAWIPEKIPKMCPKCKSQFYYAREFVAAVNLDEFERVYERRTAKSDWS